MIRSSLAAAGLLLALSGFAEAKDPMAGMAMESSHTSASPAVRANAAAMDKMMKSMHVKPTGNPDKDFVSMMLPHHEGAVEMAKVELQYGKYPELRALASDVVAAQEKEITQMKAWLAAHP